MKQDKTTDFGYQDVPYADKQKLVHDVFESVANKYDLMNDLMSLGIHRLWKRYCVELSFVRPGDRVLDVAAGSGDLGKLFSKKIGSSGKLILTDINQAMLDVGKRRLLDEGFVENINFVIANAEELPFKSNYFNAISIAFGLRNVTDKDKALRSMYRLLKPGGRLLVLEFSTPTLPALKTVYDTYSFSLLPKIGEWIARDADSYRYLAESIRMHPNQQALQERIVEAGFDECQYHNLSGGIVALHIGYKY